MAEDIATKAREMAAAWKRWGADGIYMGESQSDIVLSLAAEIERLRASLSRAEEWRGEVVAALASFGFNSLGEPTFEAGYPDIRKLISLRDRGASLAGGVTLEEPNG